MMDTPWLRSSYLISCLAALFLGLYISCIQQRFWTNYSRWKTFTTFNTSSCNTGSIASSSTDITSVISIINTITIAHPLKPSQFTSSISPSTTMSTSDSTTPSRPPVYFLGIGGPNFLEQPSHPAASKLATTGLEMTRQIKPSAIVVLSAHWQQPRSGADRVSILGHGDRGSGNSTNLRVSVNVAEDEGIIYDFHGFPKRFYEHQYPYKGSREVADKVVTTLEGRGVRVDRVRRGLDHGVWVGFLAAFDPKTNPLNVPIVQVSLLAEEDADAHYQLGQALSSLRDENILIIGAGMAVHNLNDYRAIRANGGTVSYAGSFDDLLEEAVATDSKNRQDALSKLLATPEAKQAHPSLEHVLPIVVAAGAAGIDKGERIWTFAETSLNWAQYRFGEVPKA